MMEGIKSWLTLSKKDKEHFYSKFKECQISYKNKLADYLKKAQPYLKKKQNVKRSSDAIKEKNDEITKLENETNNQTITLNTSEIHNSLVETEDHFQADDETNAHNTVCKMETPVVNEEVQSNRVELMGPQPVLAEPTPPSIRTAKDLFDLLNTNNGSNETWSSIPNTQKSRYRRAVQLLKNDYIIKYKAYLQSLPCRELFEHYNNFFD